MSRTLTTTKMSYGVSVFSLAPPKISAMYYVVKENGQSIAIWPFVITKAAINPCPFGAQVYPWSSGLCILAVCVANPVEIWGH